MNEQFKAEGAQEDAFINNPFEASNTSVIAAGANTDSKDAATDTTRRESGKQTDSNKTILLSEDHFTIIDATPEAKTPEDKEASAASPSDTENTPVTPNFNTSEIKTTSGGNGGNGSGYSARNTSQNTGHTASTPRKHKVKYHYGPLFYIICFLALMFTVDNDGGLILNSLRGNESVARQVSEWGFSESSLISGSEVYAGFTDLNIDCTSTAVTIEEGSEYKVEYNMINPHFTYKNGELTIEEGNSSFMDILNNASWLKITMPKGKAVEMDLSTTSGSVSLNSANVYGNIQTTSGSVSISDCEAQRDLDITTSSGSVRLTSVTVPTLSVETTSGSHIYSNITADRLNAVSSSGSVKVADSTFSKFMHDSTSGSLNISDSSIDILNSDATSGSANVELIGDKDDYSFDLSTTSGNIKVGTMSTSKDYEVKVRSKKEIEIDHTSGSINIQFKY